MRTLTRNQEAALRILKLRPRQEKSRWEIILDRVFQIIILFAVLYGFFMLGRVYEIHLQNEIRQAEAVLMDMYARGEYGETT